MRFIVSEHRDGAQGTETWAPPGEPVVPNFPTGDRNTFLGVKSFKPVPYGRVTDIDGLDPDTLVETLADRYKGLPKPLLSSYVVEMAVFAYNMPIGLVCQPYLDDDGERLTIRVVSVPDGDKHSGGVAEDDVYAVWEKQPVEGAGL